LEHVALKRVEKVKYLGSVMSETGDRRIQSGWRNWKKVLLGSGMTKRYDIEWGVKPKDYGPKKVLLGSGMTKRYDIE